MTAVRALGAALLGALAGFLAAIVLQDVLARVLPGPRGPGSTGATLLGLLLPVLVVSGAVVWPCLDRWRQRGDAPDSSHRGIDRGT